ncbi:MULTISPECIES: response regulator [unclassified Pseudodesulfovibrio]|uniref:response regulator n=1 Tax=unclassified Pseudodesulfovibrio TaxID=2661612 RepID=UPI000FEB8815|nr:MULTISPECIES: response regulator [unclassified Pseudodesulfovibrio]MCJ2165126.1 response regulator [Pseudodesulfovibrio sp. S3-i]RWU03416.1 response regulator [Pseudodesulfovibrio sp. S3]
MSIVVATTRADTLTGFMTALAVESGLDIEVLTSGKSTLEKVKVQKPRLVVIDEGLPDLKPLELVREILMVSAMTLTAVITDMAEEDFHEASEGYGVLKALPLELTRDHGKELAGLLAGV